MASILEAVLAIIGLVTLLVPTIVLCVLSLKEVDEAQDGDVLATVHRISSAAYEAQLQLLREQQRYERGS